MFFVGSYEQGAQKQPENHTSTYPHCYTVYTDCLYNE
jgi:hypothetical protein